MATLPPLEPLPGAGDVRPFSLRLLPEDPRGLLEPLSPSPASSPLQPSVPSTPDADEGADGSQPDPTTPEEVSASRALTWAGWYDQQEGSSSEAHSAQRLTDRALDASSIPCREGLIHTLEKRDMRPRGSKFVVPRPAPVHELSDVLAALVGVAASGSGNQLFQWDSHRAWYRWAGTLGQQERAKEYLQSVQTMRAAHVHAPVPPFAEWQGPERIAGISSPASQSLIRPFLEVGTMLRRLQEQGTDLLQFDPPSNELRALVRGVDVVLSWAIRRLRHWTPSGGAVALSHEVEETRALLLSLCRLLDCAPNRSPPFKLSFDAAEPAKVLNHVYAHYVSSLPGGPPLVQRTLLWVLEKVSYDWRHQVAAWVGWPGAEPHPSHQVGDEAVATLSQQAGDLPFRKTDPWAGARVEWTVDPRGEEDVGYRLLPSKLPSFISVAKARSVLEAGRAVRLLRKAARPDHPLVQLLGQKDEEGLPLPSWLSSEEEHAQRRAQAQARIRDLQHRVALWRHSRSGGHSSTAEDGNEVEKQLFPPAAPACAPSRPGMGDPLGLLALCDLPPLGEDDEEEDDEFQHFARWVTSRNSPGDKPAQRLLELPLLWSQLISGALISVFFRDVGLPTYLDTCRHFLLLGSAPFAEHMQDLLFADGVDSRPVLGEGLSPSLGQVWPPSPGTIAPRFNAAVLEAVAGWRSALARQEAGVRGQKRDVLLDLDERLSFAVVDPYQSKIRGRKRSRWQDPKSIDALDWLTLSFTPPSLIAPLLTAQAQLSYQRVLNLLLRIMRIQAVLRGLYTKLFKLRQARGDIFTLFFARAQHFITHLGAHAEQVAIKDMWDSFQSRLAQLQAHVEQQDAFVLVEDEEDEGEESDEDVAPSFVSRAPSTRDGGTKGTVHELKDIFSLAQYHERVLDRMVGCLFQKTNQGNVGKMIDDLFQLILSFSQVVSDDPDDGEGQAQALLSKFDTRFGTLVRALRIVERSGRRRRPAHEREVAPSGLDEETRAELQRQLDEAEQDLRLLEVEARTQPHGEAEWASLLVTRLDPTLRYID